MRKKGVNLFWNSDEYQKISGIKDIKNYKLVKSTLEKAPWSWYLSKDCVKN